MTSERFITTWRKPEPDKFLEWDHHVSECRRDAETVVANIKLRGVRQFRTFRLGDSVPELSSAQ